MSVLPSVTIIFLRTFLSNFASQPLQTRYGASPKGPTHRYRIEVRQLLNSGFPARFIFGLVSDAESKNEPSRETVEIVGVNSVSKNSQISCWKRGKCWYSALSPFLTMLSTLLETRINYLSLT